MTRSTLTTRRNCGSGVPLLLLGGLAVAFGVVFASATSLALGFVLVLFPALVYAANRLNLRGLKVSRVAPDSAFEGDEIEIGIILRNTSRLPAFLPLVSDLFAPEFHSQKEVLFAYRVRPGETVDGVYKGRCLLPRGVYTVGPVAITVTDPFGWFQARKHVILRHEIKVYPRFEHYGVEDRHGRMDSLITERLASRIGHSDEFFGVREYRSGDPLRRIHWPLTAHRGLPVVREFASPARGDLYLYLDLYRYGLLGIGRGSSLEHSVKIAAALTASALERNCRVQLTGQGAEHHFLPLGSGRAQLQALLDLLVHVKPDGSQPLDEMIAENAHSIPAASTLVLMVSPYLRSSKRFEIQLRELRRRGVRVVVVLFDDDSFRVIYELRSEIDVRQYRQRLESTGIETFLVPCAANLAAVFSEPAGVGG